LSLWRSIRSRYARQKFGSDFDMVDIISHYILDMIGARLISRTHMRGDIGINVCVNSTSAD
jgi:hypothetical protein